MKPKELLDSWSVSGRDYNEFKARVQDMTQATEVVETNTSDIAIFSIPSSVKDVEKEDKLPLRIYCAPQITQRMAPLDTFLSLSKCRERGIPEEILQEITTGAKLMLQLAGGLTMLSETKRLSTFFVSSGISRDLAARARLSGDAVYDPTEERNAYIMSRYAIDQTAIKAVIRSSQDNNGNSIHKVFALPTKTYCDIPQTVVLEILDALQKELGKMEVETWRIDHTITQLWATFPEKAEDISAVYKLPDTLEPGILIETSDTGDCALRIYAAWRAKSNRSIIGAYQHEHRGAFSVTAAIKDIQDKLLAAYTKLPERLCELLTIDIEDPEAAVESILKSVTVEESITSTKKRSLKSVLGAKRVSSLATIVNDDLSGGKMTAYDLVMVFMQLPARMEDDRIRNVLERAAGNIPFLDFDKISKATHTVRLKAPKTASKKTA